MKTFKLITAIATASMFVACVEDLAPVENVQQEMDVVVGGEVIGTDVSMNFPVDGVETKFTGGKFGWDAEDMLGLGWIVKTSVDYNQNLGEGPDQTKLYANHLFYVNEDTQKFETRGNIYKGWHFSYFPYQRMEKVGNIEFNLNPKQTSKFINEDGTSDNENYYMHLGKKLQISALQFLDKESLTGEYLNELKPEIDFTPQTPLAQIRMTVEPAEGSAFADNSKPLKDSKIKSINIYTGGPSRFITSATLNPTQLHKYDGGKTEEENADLLKESFKNALEGTASTNLVIDLKDVEYKVGSKAAALAYTLPPFSSPSLSPSCLNDASIIVTTDSGVFTIKYTNPAVDEELTAWESANNAALESLIAAYKADDPATTEVDENGALKLCGGELKLKLQLHEDIFTLDWTVGSYEDWTAKVDLAKSLNREEVTFDLEDNVVFPDGDMYVGADAEGEGALDITVNASDKFYLTFEGETTWSPNVTLTGKTSVKVAKTARLLLNDNLTVHGVYNEGIIDAKKNIANGNGVENFGTINVSINSQIPTIINQNEGKVVYTVVGTETAEQIDNLVGPTSGVRGQLTNLVVNSDWAVEGAANWPALAFELNNADVTFAAGATLKSITVTGESTITGNVISDITVGAGATLTIEGNITGDVVVVEGATLTVDGDINGDVKVFGTATINATKIDGDLIVTERAKDGEAKPSVTLQSPYGVMTIGDITNYATLNVETDVYAANVETGSDSYTEIKTGFTLYYSGSKVQDGTVKGKLEAGTVNSGAGYEKIGDVFFVNAEAGLNAAFAALAAEDIKPTIVLQAPVTLTAGNLGGVAANEVITIDANGNEITFGNTNELCVTSVAKGVKLVINDATVNKANIAPIAHGEELVFDCEVEFNNITFTTNLQLRKDAVLNDVRICPETDDYAVWTPNYGQTIELNDCEIKGARGIKICEVGFDVLGYEEGKVTYYINNTTFDTKKKAAVLVRSAEGADIYWNVNNDITKVTADTKLPVWLDADAPASYANAVNVYKVDGENKVLDNTLRGFEN